MRKFTFLLLFLCILAFQGKAQRSHFLNIKSGLGIGKVRDQMSSPLIYKGIQVPSELSYIRQTDTSRREINLAFTWGNLKPDINPELTRANNSRHKMQLEFASFGKVGEIKSLPANIYLGGSWNNLLTFRDHSHTGMNFGEFVSSVNFTPKINYEFALFHNLATVSYQVGFPFFTFMLRRDYANSPPHEFKEEGDESFLSKAYNSANILKPLNFIRLKSRLQLEYQMASGNMLSLYYDFDYYEYDEPEWIESASHNFMFGTALKF